MLPKSMLLDMEPTDTMAPLVGVALAMKAFQASTVADGKK